MTGLTSCKGVPACALWLVPNRVVAGLPADEGI